MAGDAVEQDVLLKLILVIHITDLEQKRNNNNKNKTIKRQKSKYNNESWRCCEEGCLPQDQPSDLQNDYDDNSKNMKMG